MAPLPSSLILLEGFAFSTSAVLASFFTTFPRCFPDREIVNDLGECFLQKCGKV